MQPITILNTTAVNGHTYTAGTTYQVNASTFRQLVEGGAVKRERLGQATTKADAAVATVPADSSENPKLQPEAPAKQLVRRTRNTRK